MVKKVSGTTGRVIPCCWTDCERDGDTDHEARAYEPRRTVHYLFCSRRHLMFWVNSQVNMGNLPTGAKGAFGPMGSVA